MLRYPSSCVNVCLKICLATFRPMSTKFGTCTISKSTLKEIPKRICIDIDLRPSYEHHWVKIGDSLRCVKVCRLVCFYVGISGKLLEVFNRELKKGAFDVLTLDGSRYIYILIYPHISRPFSEVPSNGHLRYKLYDVLHKPSRCPPLRM